MGKYSTLLFDLDGTLTDPQVGITKSVQYALRHMDIIEPDRTKLIPFIGPPLVESFRLFYGMDEQQAWDAVRYYREYFSETGIFENAVYPGIPELLAKLRQGRKTLGVATSKPEVFAKRILEHYDLDKFFHWVTGSALDGSLVEKDEVIACALKKLGAVNLSVIVMVGDRKHDVAGAKKNGIDSVAVGFGYGSETELRGAAPTFYARTMDDLSEYLL